MRDLHRLAIVNRGEAAMRVLHAIAEYNAEHGTEIRSIALATEPDRRAWFVREADEVVDLGPATVASPDGRRTHTYLDLGRLERVFVDHDVDAVWVGWGFVAESAEFASMCERLGVTFVGPPAEVIRRLGNKVQAKRIAESVGVPVVPWSGGPVEDVESAQAAAEALGHPLLVKAAAGGGGRGIRRVDHPGDLADAWKAARAEAEHAFGDTTVFLERVVTAARHVEVQVIADQHGTVWAVGTRDCSVQRRNQKVIEESRSTVLDDEQDRSLRDAGTAICRQAGYRNAGTVEFLWDPDTHTPWFMEVNTRLQVEHPVTELTTGLDLVKLQLHVARGGRLVGDPPPQRGHAIEVRLNAEDPSRSFAPAPGRVALLRTPSGPGIRIDTGIAEGDVIASEFDSMVAKVIAWGGDRTEALARLRRALAGTITVIEGGTTNKAFLLHLLGRPELRDGGVHTRWLDELTEAGEHMPAHHGLCLVAAAIEGYDVEHEAARMAFLATAARGRPSVSEEIGHGIELRFRGQTYRLQVFRLSDDHYRVDVGDGRLVDAQVVRLGRYERRLRLGRRTYRVVADVQGPTYQIEVEGVPHRMERDDGGIVRSPAPAVVIRLLVEAGAEVAVGTPVAVLESMKMESTVAAPFSGIVRALLVSTHDQVDANAPLVQIAPTTPGGNDEARSSHVEFQTPGEIRPGEVPDPVEAVRAFLLGYDLDPAVIQRLRSGTVELDGDRDERARREMALLEVFADLGTLARRQPTEERDEEILEATSPREHMIAYLRSIDRGGEGVPASFVQRLERALRHYGVTGLDRTPRLDEALHWMYRAFERLGTTADLVSRVLDRWLADGLPSGVSSEQVRTLTDRLVEAAEGRHPVVADLARSLRFRAVEEPVMEAARATVYEEMEGILDQLEADPDGMDRQTLIDALVRCPLPMRPRLMPRYFAKDLAAKRIVLEVRMRRYYRIRDLTGLEFEEIDGCLLAESSYDLDGRRVKLAVAYTTPTELDRMLVAAATVANRSVGDEQFVLDVAIRSDAPMPEVAQLSAEMAQRLATAGFERPAHRVDTTISFAGHGPSAFRTLHVTHRGRDDGSYEEDERYRNLHPMLAKRIGLWRLRNFALERLASPEDVYLFRGTAHDNPGDVRLFAIAEVWDVTPITAGDRVVALPLLERQLSEAISSIRRFEAHLPPGARPVNNRVILDVDPPLTVPSEVMREIGHRLAPSTAGLGLEKVVVRARTPDPRTGELEDSVLHLEHLARHGMVLRREPPSDQPIRALTPYRQRVLATERHGSVYPYELIRRLTPVDGSQADFPPGSFQEHDLGPDGRLVPVDRPHGENEANLVVGLVSSRTETVPEGMRRVLVAGDPSRSLGSLAEAECRRIIAALDLAEAEQVPLEWFAVSSGARIATDSGTENMDWIGAVLRRLIEFTQAGGEVNVVVTGINVGAQPYWNAEATMLMHTRGILVMTPQSAMVLTGKQALDFSGGVSAEDNFGIGGYERIMGPNGQGQYWAPTLEDACHLLLRHYDHTYVVPGERFPRRAATVDPLDRDVREHPHAQDGSGFARVGDIFSATHNPERKRPFDIRSVMGAVRDQDHDPLERWHAWEDAETAVVWDARVGGIPVCMLGIESHAVRRTGVAPADGPNAWTSGTLFPQSSKKLARAINAASGNRPLVVLANLSGFDGSPESMRRLQLEFGAEIGRAVTNFDGPMVFTVVSRYHGGAFVVFSKRLNEHLEIAAVEGSYASVIGGTPAAAVVFAREVRSRTQADPRVLAARAAVEQAGRLEAAARRADLTRILDEVHSDKIGEIAAEFDRIHTIERARAVGSVDRIIEPAELRPYVIGAVERGMARFLET